VRAVGDVEGWLAINFVAAGAGEYWAGESIESKIDSLQATFHCHPREGGDPDPPANNWIPAFAGMKVIQRFGSGLNPAFECLNGPGCCEVKKLPAETSLGIKSALSPSNTCVSSYYFYSGVCGFQSDLA
jgi:hypothetical protein